MKKFTAQCASFAFLLLTLVAASACPREISVGDCRSAEECEDGEACINGVCVDTDSSDDGNGNGNGVACIDDLGCNVNAREKCVAGVCQAPSASGQTCANTVDCPIGEFCNSSSSQCQPLLAGWCREASQCSGSTPYCSTTTSDVPGRCVECTDNSQCGVGAECISPGLCQANVVEQPDAGNGNNGGSDAGVVNPGNGGADAGNGGNVGRDGGVVDPGNPANGNEVCSQPSDCLNQGFQFTCEQGECVCDVLFMLLFVCDINSEDIDFNTCSCVPLDSTPVDPVDPVDPGTGSGTGLQENESCVSNGTMLECAAGLDCIVATDSNGDPSFGSCKQICSSNAECSGGLSCVLGFLSDGNGICGRPKTLGQTGCGFWDVGDSFCFDGSVASTADSAILECVNNTCSLICDYDGNTGPLLDCPSGEFCGFLEPVDGFSIDVAVCE